MKDDTISRQAAIDVMCELMRHWFGGDPKDEVREIKRELEKLPAVQTCDDAVSRQAAIELAMQYCPDDDGSCSKADRDIRELLDDLENLPSAQPEIIACGDCKHWICHDRRCGYWNHGVKPLDWCCHAERRTDG